MKDFTRGPSRPRGATSRRGFLTGGAGVVATTALSPLFSGEAKAATPAEDAKTLDRLEKANTDSGRRILIKGGTIVSMDQKVGNLAKGDVLIEGKKIKDIGPDLSASARDGKALVLDAKDTIVFPGFIDPHIHAWEGQLGRIIPNYNGVANDTKHYYFAVAHQIIGPQYRPEDVYVGNLLTTLACMDAGITCMCDNSHNSRSIAHADMAVKALMDSGMRAVYGGGGIRFPDDQQWDKQWPEDLRRIKKQYFASSDQLVTLRMFFAGTVNPVHAKVARDLDLWISWDGGAASPLLPQMYKDGLLVGKESYNHGTGVSEENWKLIKDHGAKINVCSRSDEQAGYGAAGNGFNGLQEALDHGVRPGLSADNGCAYGLDMFTEMQVGYFIQHGRAQASKFTGGKLLPAVTARDMLEFATIRGAECCNLESTCGSLTPGKEADINLLRVDSFRQYPLNNAIGSIVTAGSVNSLDTVFIAGQAKKFRGKMETKLTGHDLAKIRQRIDDSRQYVLAKSNWTLDIFSD